MSLQMSTPRSPATATPLITATTSLTVESLRQQLRRLNLYGLATHAEEILSEPWLARVLEVEDGERQLRNGQRTSRQLQADGRLRLRLWPKEIDRALLEELFTFAFLDQIANVIAGPNGLGKTMIAIQRLCASKSLGTSWKCSSRLPRS
jgi:RecA-family ATPase